MLNAAISITIGALLVIAGGAFIHWHIRCWRVQREDASLSDRERLHYRRQFRRRLQISGMLVLLGVLIPVGDLLIPWLQFPRLFGVYWILVLLLASWMMMLAALDWLSGRMQARAHRASLSSLLRKQRELEAEAARLRRAGSNGHDVEV